VIVLSGFKLNDGHNFGLARNLTALGACKFMTKPPNFGELLDELKRHVCLESALAVTT
jgi:hypothetical protein